MNPKPQRIPLVIASQSLRSATRARLRSSGLNQPCNVRQQLGVEEGSLETGKSRSTSMELAGNSTRRLYLPRFLPEGNSVQIPPFPVHRDPAYFHPRPKEFLPQRWFPEADSGPTSLTLESDIVLERSAFIPFSMGPANCAGKSVALKQLRYVPAVLLRNFRFEFAAGYNSDRWEEELEDRFLMAKGELPLRMVLRE